jgi:hypothetical protein
MKRSLLWAAIFALAPLWPPAWAQPDAPQAVQDAIRSNGVQTELPIDAAASEYKWLSLPPELADFLLWGAVIVGAVTIALAMRDSLPAFDRSRRLAVSTGGGSGELTPDLMFAAQSEADELAARGRYAEAMHVLLLRALAEVRERLRVSFADSMTSREILRRAPLESVARQAFAKIIGEVELTHFGDATADREDYFACRGQFESLRRSLGVEGVR